MRSAPDGHREASRAGCPPGRRPRASGSRSASATQSPASDLCDPATCLHLESGPRQGNPPRSRHDAASVGIGLRGRAVGVRPLAVPGPGEPVRERPVTLMDARLDRAPSSPRPSARDWRRDVLRPVPAASPRPSCHQPTRSSSRAASTRRTRRARCSRNGPASASARAHDIDPWVGRAVAGRSSRSRPVPRDRGHARRRGPPRHVAGRGAPAAAPGPRPPPAPAAGPAQHAAAQLRSHRRAAGHRLAAPRRVAGRRPHDLRPAPPPPGLAGGLGAGQRAPGTADHDAQRALRGADPRRRAVQGQGHRPRRVGQRPDAVRGAAGRGRAGQRLARGPGGRERGGGAGSSTSSPRWSAPTARCSGRRSRPWPSSTSGPPRRSSRRSWTACARRRPIAPRWSCCRRATRG